MTRRTADLRCRIRSGYDACTFSPSSSVAREGGTGRRADRVDGHHVGVDEARPHALSPRPDSTILRGHTPSFSSVCARDFPPHPPASFNNGPDAPSRFFALFRGCHPPAGTTARRRLARAFAPRARVRASRCAARASSASTPRQASSPDPSTNIFKYLQISSPPLSVAPCSPSSPENLPALVHHRRPLRGVRHDEWASPRVVRVPPSRGRLRRHPRRRLSLAGLSDHFPVRPRAPARPSSPPTTTSSSPRASRASSSSSPSSSTSTPRSGPRVDPDDDSTFGGVHLRRPPRTPTSRYGEGTTGTSPSRRPGALRPSPRSACSSGFSPPRRYSCSCSTCTSVPCRRRARAGDVGVRSAVESNAGGGGRADDPLRRGDALVRNGVRVRVGADGVDVLFRVRGDALGARAGGYRVAGGDGTDPVRRSLHASQRSRWWRGRRIPRCICSRTRVW